MLDDQIHGDGDFDAASLSTQDDSKMDIPETMFHEKSRTYGNSKKKCSKYESKPLLTWLIDNGLKPRIRSFLC